MLPLKSEGKKELNKFSKLNTRAGYLTIAEYNFSADDSRFKSHARKQTSKEILPACGKINSLSLDRLRNACST